MHTIIVFFRSDTSDPSILCYIDGTPRVYERGSEDPRAFLGIVKVTIENADEYRAWKETAKVYVPVAVPLLVAAEVGLVKG